jgi:hypothetical protein
MQSRVLVTGPIDFENISLSLSTEKFPKTTPAIDQAIDQKWLELIQKAQTNEQLLFNGSSFRLNKIEESYGLGSSEGTIETINLEVSPFDFRTRKCLQLLVDTVEELGFEYTGNGLAIGGLLQTTDKYYVFGERSGKTLSSNSVDFLGGVVDSTVELSGQGLKGMLFQELLEEANIPSSVIDSSICLGLIQAQVGNVMVISHTQLNISKMELEGFFREADKTEMKGLIFVPANEINSYLMHLGGYKELVVGLMI